MNSEKIKILYIAGSGRNGSTLLEKMLGQDPHLQAVGELCNTWFNDLQSGKCGCGQILINCPFWSRVFKQAFPESAQDGFARMRELNLAVDRIRYLPAIYFLEQTQSATKTKVEEYLAGMKKLYSAIWVIGNHNIIIDSSKRISWLYLLSKDPDFEVYVIHLIRDSRGVAYSWSKSSEQLSSQHGRPVALPVISPLKVALNWMGEQFVMKLICSYFKGYLILRYEDLIRDPQQSLAKVHSLVSLESPAPRIKDGSVDLSMSVHSISGNPLRFNFGLMPLAVDDVWKSKLSAKTYWLVTMITLPYLIRYRYVP